MARRKSKSTNKGPSVTPWLPYHMLVAYFVARGETLGVARQKARVLASKAFPTDTVTFSLRKPTDEAVGLARSFAITVAIERLLIGHRPEVRCRIDRLILAYTRAGYPADVALAEVYLDYASMDDVPPLTEDEVATYVHLFWDFMSLDDPALGLDYLEASLPDSDESRIWRGDLSLAQTRAACSVLRVLSRPYFGGSAVVRLNDINDRLVNMIRSDIADMISLDSARRPDMKVVKDRAALLTRTSLAQERLRRGQNVTPSMEEAVFGLDELLGAMESDRGRRAGARPDVPWDDPSALVRKPAT